MTGTRAPLAAATLPVVRTIMRKVHRGDRDRRVVGIHARPEWNGEPCFTHDEVTVHVRACPSALAVREAVVEHAARDGDYLVVLTDVGDRDLGIGLRAHLAGGHLIAIKPWELLKQSFDAKTLDPLLLEEGWAASALAAWQPAENGWPAAPGGALTRDFALGRLGEVLLGSGPDGEPYLTSGHPDAVSLLRWTLDPVAMNRFTELDADTRKGFGRWLGEATGTTGTWTLRAVQSGYGGDAVPLGLVAGLLAHPDAGVRAAEARGLLRARLGGADLPAEEARSWARAAEALVTQLDRPDSLLERAEALLREFNAEALIALSPLLPGAYDTRLRSFAQAVSDALSSPTGHGWGALSVPSPAALARVEEAHTQLVAHELAAQQPRTPTARMALRLLRWLATPPGPAPDTLAGALYRQVQDGAYVEWAYADVWTGDTDDAVGAAYQRLLEAVDTRRRPDDRSLAARFAQAVAADEHPGRLVPIEAAMATLVRPLGRVLLVVLDGMTAGNLAEIAAELTQWGQQRWHELVDADLGHRQVLLPVLPTVTEACRTSLLTGVARTGGQDDERAGFPSAAGDPRARLFHKGDLPGPGGSQLAAEVKNAIASDVRVVGVVLNTIDDALDKMNPGGMAWTPGQIQYLSALVNVAATAGRLLVLTADHGHVVERGGTMISGTGAASARWRPAGLPAGEGEVPVRGRRVLLGGGSVVLPWREDIRYTGRRAGYHGGLAAAEVAVPFAVFSPAPVEQVAGWVQAPAQEPVWWHAPLAVPSAPSASPAAPPVAAAPRAAQSRVKARPIPGQDAIFEMAPAVESAPGSGGTTPGEALATARADGGSSPAGTGGAADKVSVFLDALVASAQYAAQRERAGRAAPDDARVVAVLGALLRNGGRLHESALSAVAGVPAARMRSVLTAIRRLLSVDGYDPVTYDPDGVTVLLSAGVLAEQFGVRAP
ncbi:hypothetical protein Ssi03_19740 [Sphaerisporangium siamense]|uniref:BREX-2 system phosphatase PglZ n=1 Tax=Sphaerisporangium siamense TaxID=795645 RepID=A0A7W7GFK4_9ACTN|nr:BREX-2 system phosphatase PglZ [Sphaerisporangium siamense]MBB4705176.1 hypothetical protein [Sphaerisporangium siamense]GII83984.1 hypothetical protein Ssi03_19740 [Sphaerisporangium siamense]